ncbi:MAG TPA: molybdopterin-guanine dinucleotide biosynthesis protein B [Steroidobacteraceae bacterium]|jgi:molybdopterin-guanine dinucleotide biosynthesis protein B|nr:molybdopterin-guanine dinucleotide biosynthesis protein B [Steroidobacteraceae bacterium]
MNRARVLGIAGWSGSGKTTLIVRLIPLLIERGLSVATIKHADASFDVDQPGKDSYEHRQAGASEVIVSSARRWVQMHEIAGGAEATLAGLLARLSPCDLVLVEGYKRERHPKLEVFRRGVGSSPLYLSDARIVAVASDTPQPRAAIPVVDLGDVTAIADLVQARAEPLAAVMDLLAGSGSRR